MVNKRKQIETERKGQNIAEDGKDDEGNSVLTKSQKQQRKEFKENSKTFKSMIENLPSVVDTYVLNTETIKEQVKITLDDQNREQQQGVKQLKYKSLQSKILSYLNQLKKSDKKEYSTN